MASAFVPWVKYAGFRLGAVAQHVARLEFIYVRRAGYWHGRDRQCGYLDAWGVVVASKYKKKAVYNLRPLERKVTVTFA